MAKVGIICEGAKAGGDQQVFEFFATRLLEHDDVDVVPLGNKPNLFDRCGSTARALLDAGCDRVVVIWDLLPAWGDVPADVEKDLGAARASLASEGLQNHPCIFLIAINRELETWLVSDEVALTAVIPHPPGSSKVTAIAHPVREANPKKWLNRKFNAIGRRSYQAHSDALAIAKSMPGHLRSISKIPSFAAFREGLTQPC